VDELLREFLTETGESLAVLDTELVALERNPAPASLQNIFRLVHTIKGTCGFLSLPRLETLAHAAENVLDRLREGETVLRPETITLILAALDRVKLILAALEASGAEPPGDDRDLIARINELRPQDAAPVARVAAAELPPSAALTSIRVNLDLLETLMATVSELVLTRNQLLQILRRQDDSEFAMPLQRLSQVTGLLQDNVMRARMQPVGNAWSKLPRLVRDLARDLGKEIALEMSGEATELDRQLLELIKDPLTHMVRNSADHGLETPAERAKAGKPAAGRISLAAKHERGKIVITLADDGRGLDLAKIRAKARALGLAGDAEPPTDAQLRRFIFHPGFSTAAEVTNLSGRGVGLDVVRANIERIGGTVDVASEAGRGTAFTVTIPLTLAIVPALIVDCAGERFAVPQNAVLELVQAGAGAAIEWLNATPILRLRERLLPLVFLRDLLRLGGERKESLIAVIEICGSRFGIVVDRVAATEEIVVKPAAPLVSDIALFAGTTILGDGGIIMILDPAGIAATLGASAPTDEATPRAAEMAQEPGMTLLLFRAGAGAKAVPLGLITRLEEIDLATLETADGRDVVQYRGRIMPLLVLAGEAPLGRMGRRPVLVFAEGPCAMGLAVDAIDDIVDEAVTFEASGERPGVLASAIIAGRATDIIDAAYYLTLAGSLAAAPQKRPKRVLLVENNAFYRNLLAPLLKTAGYDTVSVESAAQALALRRSGAEFDAILSDESLAPQLRDGGWRDKPLVALGDKLDREAVIAGLAGALDRRSDAA
jgi:two-component system, chemotaxis family, sensor kinase CheA